MAETEEDSLEDEYTRLQNLKVPEVSLVDKPAVGDATFLIFKRATGEGQGQGNPKEGEGGSDYCYCDKCEAKIQHSRGEPCNKQKCPKCGEPLTGVADDKIKYKEVLKMDEEKDFEEIDLDKADKPEEEEEEEEKKKSKDEEEDEKKPKAKKALPFKEAAKQAAELLRNSTATKEEEKRQNMLIGNLLSAAGVKKASNDEDDVEKAGRKVSKETAVALADIVSSMEKAVSGLKALYSKEKPNDYDEEYGKPARKSISEEVLEVSQDEISAFFKAVKDGFIKEAEVASITATLS